MTHHMKRKEYVQLLYDVPEAKYFVIRYCPVEPCLGFYLAFKKKEDNHRGTLTSFYNWGSVTPIVSHTSNEPRNDLENKVKQLL